LARQISTNSSFVMLPVAMARDRRGRQSSTFCVELLGLPRRTIMVEFTPHPGEEVLRDGNWAADWTPAEAVFG
jgi:hypothetical protein